jgi:hypothetical protein
MQVHHKYELALFVSVANICFKSVKVMSIATVGRAPNPCKVSVFFKIPLIALTHDPTCMKFGTLL